MAATVVITGGTGNLGKVVTRTFLESGYQVIVTYRADEELRDLLEATQDKKDQLDAVRIDVTDEGSLDDLAQRIKQKYGSIESLVCLVGGYTPGTLIDTAAETFDKMMTLNAKSFLLTVNALAPYMKDTKKQKQPTQRHIVAVASRPALKPTKGVGIYGASKAAVVSLVGTLAVELAPLNISVNAVAPSTIDTPPNRKAMPKADFKTWIQPEEIAKAILFLSNESSDYITGTVLPVYGKS